LDNDFDQYCNRPLFILANIDVLLGQVSLVAQNIWPISAQYWTSKGKYRSRLSQYWYDIRYYVVLGMFLDKMYRPMFEDLNSETL